MNNNTKNVDDKFPYSNILLMPGVSSYKNVAEVNLMFNEN